MIIWFWTINNVFYKNAKKGLSDSSKNIFQEAKKLFDLRVEIYQKLVLEEENLKCGKSVGERVKLKNQGVNLSTTSEQKEFNDFLQQFKEEQKNIDTNLFKKEFSFFDLPVKMMKKLTRKLLKWVTIMIAQLVIYWILVISKKITD